MNGVRKALLTQSSPSLKSQFALNKAGFTLIEIMVVLVLMAVLLSFSVPFVQSLRPEIALEKTTRYVESEIRGAFNHALAGKSFASLGVQNNASLKLPALYGLYFSLDDQSQYAFDYLELHPDGEDMKPIFTYSHQYPTSTVALKSITLEDEKGQLTYPKEVYVLISPPFGKVAFWPENNIPTLIFEEGLSSLKKLELTFAYKDSDQHERIFSLTDDKLINIF